MIELILLIFGITSLIRRRQLSRKTSAAFPTMSRIAFDEWKRAELKAINAFLVATWGVFAFEVMAVVVLEALRSSMQIRTRVSIGFILIWFGGLTYAAILGSRSRKLLRRLSARPLT